MSKEYGYNCVICGEPLKEPQPIEHTDDGLAHAKCLAPKNIMKNAGLWLEKKGGNITIEDVLALQNDARKDGLMTALNIASNVINREGYKYAVPEQKTPPEMTLSGLSYFVTSAICTEADKLEYLP